MVHHAFSSLAAMIRYASGYGPVPSKPKRTGPSSSGGRGSLWKGEGTGARERERHQRHGRAGMCYVPGLGNRYTGGMSPQAYLELLKLRPELKDDPGLLRAWSGPIGPSPFVPLEERC